MKQSMKWISLIVCVLILYSIPAFASIDYLSAFSNSMADAEERHREHEDRSSYNGIVYTLCDMDNDGIKELIVMQIFAKHGAENWVYKISGNSSVYIGMFDSDSRYDDLRGYNNGFLYKEYYKGEVNLYHVRSTPDGFIKEKIYQGRYDRDGEPPTFEDLSAYYDGNAICDVAPEPVYLYDRSILEGASGLEYQDIGNTYNPDTVDLSQYLHTDIYKFKDSVGDMWDVGASDAMEFSNYDLIASAPYDGVEIVFFNLSSENCGFSIFGLECGMPFDVAIGTINDKIDSLISSEKGIHYYRLKDGGQLRVDRGDDGLIKGIDIWGVETGDIKEWPGWKKQNVDVNLPTDIEFISWADAGINDHEIIFNDANAGLKVRAILNRWDGAILLSDLWEIKDLDLTPYEGNTISDISFVRELRNLKTLNLNYNSITDISPVASLYQLEGLFLNSNPISDIRPLASMSCINRLDLSNTQIRDFSPLKGMTGLTTLHLYNLGIGNEDIVSVIECLAGLENLSKLNLGCNPFTDYRALGRMSQIKTLSMWDSDLDNNKLASLTSAVSSIPKLKTLSVSNNTVSDVSCLVELKKLKTLIINNNPVTDFSPLVGTKVKEIESDSFTGNPQDIQM